MSPATLMGPPFRQCEGTTSGACSVGMPMMTAGVEAVKAGACVG